MAKRPPTSESTGPVMTPVSLAGACALLAERPDALVLAGGTDLMVEINAGHRNPRSVLSLAALDELRSWRIDQAAGTIFIGAGVSYSRLAAEDLADAIPALAQAARTVGSPQIRNAGTIGGNLGTGSPAGDTLPVLAALGAEVHLASADGELVSRRTIPIHEYLLGPKHTARDANEIIVGVDMPLARGPQEFMKIGTRTAMVISIANLAAVADVEAGTIRVGLGAVGPTPIRPVEAEEWAATQIDWTTGTVSDPSVYEQFGVLVANDSLPIDDHRSIADYRRHSVGVMAKRALRRMFPLETESHA